MAFGPFNRGGGNNMQQLMKQAQEMEKQMRAAKDQLKDERITAAAGGGMVEATVTGDKKLLTVKIKPEVVDPDDIETLEDLITAAVNEALNQVDQLSKDKLGEFGA